MMSRNPRQPRKSKLSSSKTWPKGARKLPAIPPGLNSAGRTFYRVDDPKLRLPPDEEQIYQDLAWTPAANSFGRAVNEYLNVLSPTQHRRLADLNRAIEPHRPRPDFPPDGMERHNAAYSLLEYVGGDRRYLRALGNAFRPDSGPWYPGRPGRS